MVLRRNTVLVRHVIFAITTVAVLAATPLTAAAVSHPQHELADIGDGPARENNGVGRNSPAGANGTIKIDGAAFDGHPNNEPHIQNCFQVDFYGFDEGDTATLTFTAWPGTGDGATVVQVVDNIAIGPDGAGGGIDIDQQLDVILPLVGDGHPQHGHHVRVDAAITSIDGRTYTKTKVFWVTNDCDDSSTHT